MTLQKAAPRMVILKTGNDEMRREAIAEKKDWMEKRWRKQEIGKGGKIENNVKRKEIFDTIGGRTWRVRKFRKLC